MLKILWFSDVADGLYSVVWRRGRRWANENINHNTHSERRNEALYALLLVRERYNTGNKKLIKQLKKLQK